MKVVSRQLATGEFEVTATISTFENLLSPAQFVSDIIEALTDEYLSRNKERVDNFFGKHDYEIRERVQQLAAQKIAEKFLEQNFQSIASMMDPKVIANLAVAAVGRDFVKFSKNEE